MQYPETDYSCTYQMSKEAIQSLYSHSLDIVCNHFGIALNNHHRALADAEACAEIAIRLFQEKGLREFKEIRDYFNLNIGRLMKNGYKASAKRRKKHIR